MTKNMKIEDYQQLALRTFNSKDYLTNILHTTLGLTTEAAELADVVKKHVAYNKELDLPNMKEELGDILWFAVVMCNVLDFELDDVMNTNIKKLQIRYPEKYSDVQALVRNLEAERVILEQKN